MAGTKKKPRKMSAAAGEVIAGLEQLRYAFEKGDFCKVTVRTVEVSGPAEYGAKDV
jgi:hypothetical protein